MKVTRTHSSGSLLWMLMSLTSLLIAGQIALFYIHYRVSELIDSLVHSVISQGLLQPAILFPLIQFVLIQLSAYLLWVGGVWFMAISISEYFHWSGQTLSWVGFFLWLMACAALFSLNDYYFPHSFFSQWLQSCWGWNEVRRVCLWTSCSILLSAISLAYIHFFRSKRYRAMGSVLLGGLCSMAVLFLHDQFFLMSTNQAPPPRKPHVILIGLDSLRPDFVSYFAEQDPHPPFTLEQLHTPHIDHFLETSAIFTAAYTPLARTFPAWVSILTAQYPKHHHIRYNLAPVQSISDNLAKHLQQAGYKTIYATDEKRFSNVTEAYGFDHLIGPKMGINDFILGGLNDFPLSNLLIRLPIGRWLFPYNYGNRAAAVTYEPEQFLYLVKQGLRQHSQRPLFLAIHLCLSHWPFTWARDGQTTDLSLAERYRRAVIGVDAQLGQLLRLLKKEGLLTHSVVVLLSDHGTTVGLPGDRLITQKHYLGDRHILKRMPVFSGDMAHPSTLDPFNTSYGQGTDLLSLKQYRVLLAFKGFGPPHHIETLHSLMDIAPTILAFLHLPPLLRIDGHSLLPDLATSQPLPQKTQPLFMETADHIADTETDRLLVEKIVKEQINAYQLNPKNGLLFLGAEAERLVIAGKQRSVLLGHWLLVYYPASVRSKLVPAESQGKRILVFQTYLVPAYFALADLHGGQWTMDLSTPFARSAPLQKLMHDLYLFYGKELPAV